MKYATWVPEELRKAHQDRLNDTNSTLRPEVVSTLELLLSNDITEEALKTLAKGSDCAVFELPFLIKLSVHISLAINRPKHELLPASERKAIARDLAKKTQEITRLLPKLGLDLEMDFFLPDRWRYYLMKGWAQDWQEEDIKKHYLAISFNNTLEENMGTVSHFLSNLADHATSTAHSTPLSSHQNANSAQTYFIRSLTDSFIEDFGGPKASAVARLAGLFGFNVDANQVTESVKKYKRASSQKA